MSNKKLNGILTKERVESVVINNANFAGLEFCGKRFERCVFNDCVLNACFVEGATFENVTFNNVEFFGNVLIESAFVRCVFNGCAFRQNLVQRSAVNRCAVMGCKSEGNSFQMGLSGNVVVDSEFTDDLFNVEVSSVMLHIDMRCVDCVGSEVFAGLLRDNSDV